jgi:hypothetical protein
LWVKLRQKNYNPHILEALENGIQNNILEITEAELLLYHRICYMCAKFASVFEGTTCGSMR